jgi:hypothetical protein
MNVFNPPNAEPIVMERITNEHESRQGGPVSWIHTKVGGLAAALGCACCAVLCYAVHCRVPYHVCASIARHPAQHAFYPFLKAGR